MAGTPDSGGHYTTPEADRLSRWQKVAYGLGGQTASLIPNSLFALANPLLLIFKAIPRPDLLFFLAIEVAHELR